MRRADSRMRDPLREPVVNYGLFCCVTSVTLLLFPLAVVWWVQQRQSAAEAFEQFAEEHGMDFSSDLWSGPEIRGVVSDVPIEISTWDKQAREQRTRFCATLDEEFPTSLRVWTDGFLDELDKRSGGEAVVFDDAAFDEAFIVESHDPDVGANSLGPEARAALVDLQSTCEFVRVEDGLLECRVVGHVDEVEGLREQTEALAECWRRLTSG